MKAFVFSVILLVGSFASASIARNVVCSDPRIQDNYYNAAFSLIGSEGGGETASVKLYVPSGEFSGQAYNGTCVAGRGIPERPIPYLACEVNAGPVGGYWVHLWKDSSGQFEKATIYPMGNNTPVIVLPSCKL